MALPTTIRGTQLYIKIGNGGAPEVFTHPCLISAERGINFRSSSNDIEVPDCTNPEDPAWRELVKGGLSVGLSGEGILDNVLATIQFYTNWWKADTGKNVQIWLGTVGYWSGSFKLTEWAINGTRGQKATVSISLESDGIVAGFSA